MADGRQLGLPASLPAVMADRLTVMYGRVETTGGRRGEILERHALTPAERTAFRERLETVADSLAPAPRAEIALVLKDMFRGYPSMANLPSDKKRSMIVAYVEQLDRFPLWAVRDGIQACLNAGDAYAPAHAQIRAAAHNATLGLQREHARLKKVLEAEVRRESTPEERAAAVARWKARRAGAA